MGKSRPAHRRPVGPLAWPYALIGGRYLWVRFRPLSDRLKRAEMEEVTLQEAVPFN